MNYYVWEYIQTAIDVFLLGGLIGIFWALRQSGKQNQAILNELIQEFEAARGLIEAEIERKDAHTKAFEVLSNPDLIAEEMENSARATEMRIARRTTLPREDAGPPAKVYRPKIRKLYPRSWPK
jgi:hypothetical protein